MYLPVIRPLTGRNLVKQGISEDYYRLVTPEGVLILDDPACEDFYGDIDDVADFMSECIREDASKVLSWWELLDGVCVIGHRQESSISSKKDAEYMAENMSDVEPVTDKDEFKEAEEKLDLWSEAKRIYKFTMLGERGYVALYKDF